jgi:ubiquinone/menaquinone biosynthesis C-methylase UbiE
MNQKPDYSIHRKKAHSLFPLLMPILVVILLAISLVLGKVVLSTILGLLTLIALLGLVLGKRKGHMKRVACAAISAALGKEGARVLDVGCGPGILAIRLAKYGYEMTGLDIDAQALQRAKENAEIEGVEVEFREGDGSSLPWPDEAFDGVASLHLLHEAKDPGRVLKEAHRVLKPGGILAMVDFRRSLAVFAIFWVGLVKFLTRGRLHRLAQEAGFVDIDISRPTMFHHLVVAKKRES